MYEHKILYRNGIELLQRNKQNYFCLESRAMLFGNQIMHNAKVNVMWYTRKRLKVEIT